MQDQKDNSLIDPMGDCTQAILNLVILGKATPYLHNGAVNAENEETGQVNKLYLIQGSPLMRGTESLVKVLYILTSYTKFDRK